MSEIALGLALNPMEKHRAETPPQHLSDRHTHTHTQHKFGGKPGRARRRCDASARAAGSRIVKPVILTHLCLCVFLRLRVPETRSPDDSPPLRSPLAMQLFMMPRARAHSSTHTHTHGPYTICTCVCAVRVCVYADRAVCVCAFKCGLWEMCLNICMQTHMSIYSPFTFTHTDGA